MRGVLRRVVSCCKRALCTTMHQHQNPLAPFVYRNHSVVFWRRLHSRACIFRGSSLLQQAQRWALHLLDRQQKVRSAPLNPLIFCNILPMYVVADFAAGPVQYGSAREGDGAVPPQMPVWSGGYGDMARLVKVVGSALDHVIAPDVYGQQIIRLGVGDWGLGIGGWGLGV